MSAPGWYPVLSCTPAGAKALFFFASSVYTCIRRGRGKSDSSNFSSPLILVVEALDIEGLLHKNLAEAAEKALARCRAALRKDQQAKETLNARSDEAAPAPLLTTDGRPYSAHQMERYDRYQQVVTLRQKGMPTKEIAQRVGLGRRTVQSWLAHNNYPEPTTISDGNAAILLPTSRM
jgi:hypothetical protein